MYQLISIPRSTKIELNPLADDDNAVGDVCISNISLAERRKRLQFGIQQFSLALVVLILLLAFGADKLWRLPLFFLFASAATGYFQAKDKT